MSWPKRPDFFDGPEVSSFGAVGFSSTRQESLPFKVTPADAQGKSANLFLTTGHNGGARGHALFRMSAT